MSNCSQLGALMKKNVILMKRSILATICEIFFPIILMLLLVLIRKAIQITDVIIPLDDAIYLKSQSAAFINDPNLSSWNDLTIHNPL